MKRLLNVVGGLLGLLALGTLVVTLALAFGGLQRSAEPTSQAFQSPIGTPTPPRGLPPVPISNDLTEPIQLTTRPAGRWGLDADGDTAVWQERDPNGTIYIVAHDLHTHTERRLSSLPGGKRAPRVSGRYVVWVESYQGEDRYMQEIHGYDLLREQEFVLGEGDLPDISGHRVIWNDPWTDRDSPLVLYDLSSGQIQRLIGLRGKGAYISGDWIIYASHHLGTYSQADLYAYNLVTTKQIALGSVYDPPNALANQFMAIDGSLVVWEDAQGQTYVYDLTRRNLSHLENPEGPIAGHFSRGVLLGFRRAFNLVDGSTFQTFLPSSSHPDRWGEQVPDYVIGEVVNDGETLVWTACAGTETIHCETNDVFLARRRR